MNQCFLLRNKKMNVSGSVREMEIQQLCGVQPVESSSNLETNKTCQSDLNANLQKLSRDLETQYSQEIPSLPSILLEIMRHESRHALPS
ncbi:unnamed protein product [Rhizophagus irregularis]|uniref:Uncharacterized protein n=1 Tax=Rhizophagus irregularis TaxID=588596 RepID=A0A916E727_9GLOM|nr:unnamed protein product [Rhizophagus irregularis]CAB5364771.1 unnamed protein product [Rhizophagus irregularis]